MRHIQSNTIADLADFYDNDVELITVQHKPAERFAGLAKSLYSSRQLVEADWLQDPEDALETRKQLATRLDEASADAISAEISEATSALAALLGCQSVGIRVAMLHKPMCPRFHVDRIPCRLLITLDGAGTEWIADGDLDRDALVDRASDTPPTRDGGSIAQLPTGAWSLLKGGSWEEGYGGLAHRSPAAVGERLLVSIDPVFED